MLSVKLSRIACLKYVIILAYAVCISLVLIIKSDLISKMEEKNIAGFAVGMGILGLMFSLPHFIVYLRGLIKPKTVITIDWTGITYEYFPHTKISFPWSAIESHKLKNILLVPVLSINFTQEYLNEISMTRENVGIIWRLFKLGNVNITTAGTSSDMYELYAIFSKYRLDEK